MDNLGNNSLRSGDSDKPIPLDGGPSAPVPAKGSPAGSPAPVSRAPLNLGGTGTPVANPAVSPAAAGPAHLSPAAPAATPKPAPNTHTPQVPVRKPVTAPPGPTGRITTCRTFFTKLHPGAIKFMDDQISDWLKNNPGIVIKNMTVVTGDIVDKKTEPNILMTIWY